MKIVRLEFLGMNKLVEIHDSAKRYEIVIPLQSLIANRYSKKKGENPDECRYGRLIFDLAGNERFGYFEDEPIYKLIFSHVEI